MSIGIFFPNCTLKTQYLFCRPYVEWKNATCLIKNHINKWTSPKSPSYANLYFFWNTCIPLLLRPCLHDAYPKWCNIWTTCTLLKATTSIKTPSTLYKVYMCAYLSLWDFNMYHFKIPTLTFFKYYMTSLWALCLLLYKNWIRIIRDRWLPHKFLFSYSFVPTSTIIPNSLRFSLI